MKEYLSDKYWETVVWLYEDAGVPNLLLVYMVVALVIADVLGMMY